MNETQGYLIILWEVAIFFMLVGIAINIKK